MPMTGCFIQCINGATVDNKDTMTIFVDSVRQFYHHVAIKKIFKI